MSTFISAPSVSFVSATLREAAVPSEISPAGAALARLQVALAVSAASAVPSEISAAAAAATGSMEQRRAVAAADCATVTALVSAALAATVAPAETSAEAAAIAATAAAAAAAVAHDLTVVDAAAIADHLVEFVVVAAGVFVDGVGVVDGLDFVRDVDDDLLVAADWKGRTVKRWKRLVFGKCLCAF